MLLEKAPVPGVAPQLLVGAHSAQQDFRRRPVDLLLTAPIVGRVPPTVLIVGREAHSASGEPDCARDTVVEHCFVREGEVCDAPRSQASEFVRRDVRAHQPPAARREERAQLGARRQSGFAVGHLGKVLGRRPLTPQSLPGERDVDQIDCLVAREAVVGERCQDRAVQPPGEKQSDALAAVAPTGPSHDCAFEYWEKRVA